MDPKKEKYGNSGELFEEVIGNLYGDEKKDEEDEEKADEE
jgi:hypothetical protein